MIGIVVNWFTLPAILALAAKVLLLGYVTSARNQENFTRFFIWFLLALGVQNIAEIIHFVALNLADSDLLRASMNLYYAATMFALPAMLALGLQLALGSQHQSKIKSIWLSCFTVCVTLAILILVSDVIIDGYEIIAFSAKRIPGEFFILLELVLLTVVISTIGLFVYGSINGQSVRLKMINTYMLVGMAPLVLTVVVFTLLLRLFNLAYNAALIVPFTVTFFLIVSAYAIKNQRLFDIQFTFPWTALAKARKGFHERLAELAKELPATIPKAIEEVSSVLSCPVAMVGMQEPIVVGGNFDLEGITRNQLKGIHEWTPISKLRKKDKQLSNLLSNKGIDTIVPLNPGNNPETQAWLFFGDDKNSQLVTRSDVLAVQKLLQKIESSYDNKMTRLSRQIENYQAREVNLLRQIDELKGLHPQSNEKENHIDIDEYLVVSAAKEEFQFFKDQGAHIFKKPEAAFKVIRSSQVVPKICVVDLSTTPNNLIKSIDLRINCAKIWTGAKAPNPDHIVGPGLFQERNHSFQLSRNIDAVYRVSSAMLNPNSKKIDPPLPLITSHSEYKNQLNESTEIFRNRRLFGLTSSDKSELLSVAYYLGATAGCSKISEIKSSLSLASIIEKIKNTKHKEEICIVVHPKVTSKIRDTDWVSWFPSSYVIFLSHHPLEINVPFSALPALINRKNDINLWVAWFVMRLSIVNGIAISDLDNSVSKILNTLHGDIVIDDIGLVCERALKKEVFDKPEEKTMSFEDKVRNYERQILREALEDNGGNLTATARSLCLAESTLRYKVQSLGLHISKFRKDHED